MLDSERNSPFLLNEHGDPQFFPVFAKNSPIKNIFEEEKKFDSGTRFQVFFENSFPTGCNLAAEARTLSQQQNCPKKCNIPAAKQSKTA